MKKVYLKKGKEKKVKNFYTWIFRDEIEREEGKAEDGGIVYIYDFRGDFLGKGFWSKSSHIALRVFDSKGEDDIDSIVEKRFKKAIEIRKGIKETNAIRLFYSEGDGFPGLILDKYDRTIVLQSRIKGIDVLKGKIVEKIIKIFNPSFIFERSDGDFRAEEGLEDIKGPLYGEEPKIIVIEERGMKFYVDIKDGMKTGFYLDQRENRKRAEKLVSKDMECLDLFSYTGAFSLFLSRKGAKVRAVELEGKNIEIGMENAELNKIKTIEFVCGNAYDFLEDEAQRGKKYDLIIADPPGIVKKKSEVERGKWAYWKILYNSFKIAREGCIIILSCCSYHVSLQTLIEMARLASSDSGVKIRFFDITFQPIDHPWLLQIPETLYLKSLYLVVEK
ncbi:MAG: class I SAM-dependent rRNA methyltransferase [Candidatus Aminicenantia bacterium]